jgi:hypothetical protein
VWCIINRIHCRRHGAPHRVPGSNAHRRPLRTFLGRWKAANPCQNPDSAYVTGVVVALNGAWVKVRFSDFHAEIPGDIGVRRHCLTLVTATGGDSSVSPAPTASHGVALANANLNANANANPASSATYTLRVPNNFRAVLFAPSPRVVAIPFAWAVDFLTAKLNNAPNVAVLIFL